MRPHLRFRVRTNGERQPAQHRRELLGRRRRDTASAQADAARWMMLARARSSGVRRALPARQTVYQSFTDEQFLGGSSRPNGSGCENYRDLSHDTIFRDSVG